MSIRLDGVQPAIDGADDGHVRHNVVCRVNNCLLLCQVSHTRTNTLRQYTEIANTCSNYHLGWFDSVKDLHNASLASIQSPACIQTLGPVTTTTDNEGWTTTTMKTTAPITSVLVQNAWHISWQTTDVKHLTPSPPPWPCSDNYGYPTWVPTVSITPEPNCNDGQYVDHSFDALGRFLYIGLPIICVAVLLSCCACFYRAGRLGGAPRRRRMQARAKRAARAGQAREDQQALQVARTADAIDVGDSIPLKVKP